MKITRLETMFVQPRWLFLKMHTDEGLVGYGEPIVEGRARTVAAAIHEMEPYLIGQDPRRIEHHWQVLYRGTFYRGGPVLTSALSGVEQAMWDILGKSLGVPIHQLLGGSVRERVRVYAHCGSTLPYTPGAQSKGAKDGTSDEELRRESIATLVASARDRVAAGFTALKTSFDGPVRYIDTKEYLDYCVERIDALRSAVPSSVDIAVDCHGRFSPPMAIRLARELEPYQLMFLEEPCLPDNVDAMATVARSTSIPIATGERLFTRWGFRQVLEKQAAVVLQPDLCHCGGIFEARKIAAMAETYYCAVAPHNPLGPISLAAGLQLDACTPNFLCQEQVNMGEGYLTEPFAVRDGYVALTDGPGLGIELDEDAVGEKVYDGAWDTPHWFDPHDGAFAEW